MKFCLRKKSLEINEPVVMGILNVTPDSFSDGGDFFRIDTALKQAASMIKEGADIIDVGGESTRPGANTVSVEEEIDRVIPVIERIKEEFDTLVSVDTMKEKIARIAVLEADADIINDISALRICENIAETVARLEVPVIMMHIQGTPESMQMNPHYVDIISEIKKYFFERINYATSKGIKRERIIIDPGIGFGKNLEHNIKIVKNLAEFKEFGLPILIGLSRKSFLGKISEETNAKDREIETVTAGIVSILNGASIIRVHNVKNAVRSIKVLKKLADF